MRISKNAWRLKLAAVGLLSATAVLAIERNKGQWALVTDVQKYYRCLPYDWYFVTGKDGSFKLKRGTLVQFEPPVEVERFSGEFEIVKIVAGVAGDRWRVTNDQLYINDALWGDLFLLNALGAETGAFDGEGVVPDGHVYVLGTNPSSYDSRYWGPLNTQQIRGEAHVIY